MKRTKAQAQETRDNLLLAALDVFNQRGVARASLNEIAQTAGVTRGALYWHFKNKEDLFEALFQRIFCDVSQQLEDDIRQSSPDMLRNLRQALINLFDRVENNPLHRKFSQILHLKCEHTEDNAAVVAVMNRYHQMWHEQTLAALALCVRQGALPATLDMDAAVTYLKATVFGLMRLWLFDPTQLKLADMAPRTIDATLRALQHDPTLRTPTLTMPPATAPATP